jgi:hypothetical protein
MSRWEWSGSETQVSECGIHNLYGQTPMATSLAVRIAPPAAPSPWFFPSEELLDAIIEERRKSEAAASIGSEENANTEYGDTREVLRREIQSTVSTWLNALAVLAPPADVPIELSMTAGEKDFEIAAGMLSVFLGWPRNAPRREAAKIASLVLRDMYRSVPVGHSVTDDEIEVEHLISGEFKWRVLPARPCSARWRPFFVQKNIGI